MVLQCPALPPGSTFFLFRLLISTASKLPGFGWAVMLTCLWSVFLLWTVLSRSTSLCQRVGCPPIICLTQGTKPRWTLQSCLKKVQGHESLFGGGFDCGDAFTAPLSSSILPSCCGISAILIFLLPSSHWCPACLSFHAAVLQQKSWHYATHMTYTGDTNPVFSSLVIWDKSIIGGHCKRSWPHRQNQWPVKINVMLRN